MFSYLKKSPILSVSSSTIYNCKSNDDDDCNELLCRVEFETIEIPNINLVTINEKENRAVLANNHTKEKIVTREHRKRWQLLGIFSPRLRRKCSRSVFAEENNRLLTAE